MAAPTFEWDPTKVAANLRSHGVSFEEAATTFQDPLARIHEDPGRERASVHWLGRVARREPQLFVTGSSAFGPRPGYKSRMRRELHVRFCEGGG